LKHGDENGRPSGMAGRKEEINDERSRKSRERNTARGERKRENERMG
jgi:hypothetical protein